MDKELASKKAIEYKDALFELTEKFKKDNKTCVSTCGECVLNQQITLLMGDSKIKESVCDLMLEIAIELEKK